MRHVLCSPPCRRSFIPSYKPATDRAKHDPGARQREGARTREVKYAGVGGGGEIERRANGKELKRPLRHSRGVCDRSTHASNTLAPPRCEPSPASAPSLPRLTIPRSVGLHIQRLQLWHRQHENQFTREVQFSKVFETFFRVTEKLVNVHLCDTGVPAPVNHRRLIQ